MTLQMALIESIPRVLLMVCLCCVIGICIGYPVAKWLGARMAEILSYLPQEKSCEPQPALGISASKAGRGDLGSAVKGYETLLFNHPKNKEIAMRGLNYAPAAYQTM